MFCRFYFLLLFIVFSSMLKAQNDLTGFVTTAINCGDTTTIYNSNFSKFESEKKRKSYYKSNDFHIQKKYNRFLWLSLYKINVSVSYETQKQTLYVDKNIFTRLGKYRCKKYSTKRFEYCEGNLTKVIKLRSKYRWDNIKTVIIEFDSDGKKKVTRTSKEKRVAFG